MRDIAHCRIVYWCTRSPHFSFFFFFNDTATTEIYTLSLHDALPICPSWTTAGGSSACSPAGTWCSRWSRWRRSEEHTSELQSLAYLVCRLLLEKKKKKIRLPVLPQQLDQHPSPCVLVVKSRVSLC